MIAERQLPSPALHWTDGHILGNGDMGAVVWGTAERLSVGFSKHDVNDLRGPGPHGARPKASYPEIRDCFLKGDRDIQSRIAQANAGVRPGQQQLACGRLTLELLRGTQPIGFTQSLSLEKAEVTVQVRPTIAGYTYGMNYRPITARVLVAAEANLTLVELSCESAQCVRWTYDRSPDPERPIPQYAVSETTAAVALMRHDLPEDTGYAVAVSAGQPGGFAAAATPFGLTGTITFGGASGPAVLVVSIASAAHDDGNAAELATRLVVGLDATQIAALEEQHRAWWQRFWAASQIQYGDPDIERLWHMGLYALAASTRPNTSPPNLQGIWVQDEISPWHADFHFNTNVQECQWGACGANHPELQEALVRVLTDDWREELRRTGREVYGVDAAAPNVAVDWRGRAISSWGFLELSTMAWTAQHLWEQFLHTQDRELLRDTIYPYLQDSAKLYLALLVADETGQLNIELSHSPEQVWFDEAGKRYFAYGRNPSIDLSCIRTLFAAVIEATQLLGNDQAFSEICRDALDRLAPLPVLDGVLIDYETAFFHDGDRPGKLPHCHRHPSRLMPIFPGRQIGLHSDAATLDLGRRSFREFRSYGEEGFTGWSYAYQACIAARLGLAEDAELCLRTMAAGFLFKGMLTSHNSITPGVGNYALYQGSPLFQLDALLGSMAAVNEMLVQRTTGGIIRVFPAVPASQSAAFTSLRVPGAVLVSAAKSGQAVEWVSVRAEQAGEIALASPWPHGTAVADNPAVQISDDGAIFRWLATPGTVYRFTVA